MHMITARLAAAVVLLFFLLSIGSVLAQEYAPALPIIDETGTPALSGNQYVGTFTAIYVDRSGPVVGAYPSNIQLRICGSSGCVNVAATLTELFPGTYSYAFTPPASVTGAVSIIIPGHSLRDPATGKSFPQSDTVLGTYSVSSSTPSTAPSQSSPSTPAVGGLSPQPSGPYREAVNTLNVAGASVQTGLLFVASIVVMACAGLMILPRRQGP
jgi:hypothetical protein